MKMFWMLPYQKVGFSEEEWENIPRGDRCIIRDYYLNDCDREETLKYSYYQTMHQVRMVERKYDLESRPLLSIRIEELTLC